MGGAKPGLIIVDTLAKTLGSADENGAGMSAFAANVDALSKHFGCLVLAVHHVGYGEEAQRRMRGHSSLNGALDAQILCERARDESAATLTLQKLKDELSGIQLVAHLKRVVIGFDRLGEEVSTLIVDKVVKEEAPKASPSKKTVPQSQKLLMTVINEAIKTKGKAFRLDPEGPEVCAVDDNHIRDPYFAAIAEQAEDDVDQAKLYDRQLKSFNRAVKSALDAQRIVAADRDGKRAIWLP